MDFAPSPNPIQARPISSVPPSAKLPIKRKNPDSNLIKLESPTADDNGGDHDVNARHPPFKFHRIWTEPDEIRFLQGLLDCSSEGLLFPRDLGIFYARFSNGMSQPYTKSQLSEKLRRLRKKFRVISSRLSEGLDQALLSPHDRSLYDLSMQLWHPDNSASSVPESNCKPSFDHNYKSNLIGVKVRFSPTFPCPSTAVLALPSVVKKQKIGGGFEGDSNGGAKLREVNVELEDNTEVVRDESKVKKNGGGDSKIVADVVDQSWKEIRRMIDRHGYLNQEKNKSFEKRWRDQHVAEFEVLTQRLKLMVEHSLHG